MSVSLESALPERRAARRAFDRATGFDAACFVHDEARQRLLERLDFIRLEAIPGVAVDLGCATARGARVLAERFPNARVLALDSSRGMLAAARAACAGRPSIAVLGADAERLPLRDSSVSLVLANLVLPWCRPAELFSEAARVLAPNGLLLFTTVGPDTLREVREAWAEADDALHVHAALDMHDVADLAGAAGLAEPVVDRDTLAVTYGSVAALVRDLRACGAQNVAAGRRRSLTGPRRFRAFCRALAAKGDAERFAVTVELVLGHAWAPPEHARRRGPRAEVGVPIAAIGRGSRRR